MIEVLGRNGCYLGEKRRRAAKGGDSEEGKDGAGGGGGGEDEDESVDVAAPVPQAPVSGVYLPSFAHGSLVLLLIFLPSRCSRLVADVAVSSSHSQLPSPHRPCRPRRDEKPKPLFSLPLSSGGLRPRGNVPPSGSLGRRGGGRCPADPYCRIVSSGVMSIRPDMSSTGSSLITDHTEALNCAVARSVDGVSPAHAHAKTIGSGQRTRVRTRPIFTSSFRSRPNIASSGALAFNYLLAITLTYLVALALVRTSSPSEPTTL